MSDEGTIKKLLRRGFGDLLSDAFKFAAHWAWLWIPSSAWAAMTGWLAYAWSLPGYMISAYSAAVFCLASVGAYYAQRAYLMRSLRGKLVYRGMTVAHFATDAGSGNSILQLRLTLLNNSDDQMVTRLDDLRYFVGHSGNPYAQAPDFGFIGSKTDRPVLLPAIKDVPMGEPIKGMLSLAVSYGRRRGNLPRKLTLTLSGYLLIYKADDRPCLSMNWIEDDVQYK